MRYRFPMKIRTRSVPPLLVRRSLWAAVLLAVALLAGPVLTPSGARAQDAPPTPTEDTSPPPDASPPSDAAPPSDTANEPSADAPQEEPPEDPAEEPAEEPADVPADDAADAPSQEPSQDPSGEATGETAEGPADTPAETEPSDVEEVGDPAGDPGDTMDGDPAGDLSGEPAPDAVADDEPDAPMAPEVPAEEAESVEAEPSEAAPADEAPVEEEAPVEPDVVEDAVPAAPTDPADDEAIEAPVSEAQAEDGPIEVALVDDRLVATRADAELWRRTLHPDAGPTTEPVVDGASVHIGHGLYLLTIGLDDGVVRSRAALPAPVEALSLDQGSLLATVDHGELGTRTIDAPDGAPEGPVRFGTDVEAMHGLARAARATPDPVAAAESDPTDPWLALQAAQTTADAEALDVWLERAVVAAASLPFFESLPLADRMLTIGDVERAQVLYERSLADLAERGYDPRLASDPALRAAYGFPEVRLADALDRGDLDEAHIVAPYAWRLAAEEAPGSVAVLHDLADALRADGRRDEAGIWRERARALDRAGLGTWVDALALRLGALGWWGVAGLLGAIVLSWLVLLAKVWKAQSLARRQSKERDQAPPAVTRLWVLRQASTTEKFALALLLVVAGLQATLAGWHGDVRDPAQALRSGTLASSEAVAAVEALPDTERAAWIRGLSLVQRGRLDEAVEHWRDASSLAPALTDRAVAACGDERLLEAALAADPREPVARFLTGRAGDPSPFHATTVPDAPLWAVPSPLDLRLASAGDWRAALRQGVTAPWAALGEARPASFPAWIAWILAVLYGLWFVAVVVFLVIPRPRVSRDAPRTFAYHVGALLVPGSGHADELWGLLLLVPWAFVGSDALLTLAYGTSPLGLAPVAHAWILGALWAVNLIGFSIELASYRHRMRLLREQKPELARSYGLSPAPRPEA